MEQQKKNPIWKITNIKDDTILELHGAIPAVRVTVAVAGRITTDILIPKAEFNASRANDMAHEVALEIINTMGLQGPDMQDYINQQTLGITPQY